MRSCSRPIRPSIRRARVWRWRSGRCWAADYRGLADDGAGLRGDVLDVHGVDAAALGAGGRADGRLAPADPRVEPELLGRSGGDGRRGAGCWGPSGASLRAPRVRDAIWLGVGLAVLANSRPYEGFVLGMLVLLALVIWFIEAGKVPVSTVSCGACLCRWWRCWYCSARRSAITTGASRGMPLVMPYMVHEETYGIAPLFLFGTPRPEPEYRHPEIRKLQENYLNYFRSQRRTFGALLRSTGEKIWELAQGYLWSYLMVVALLGLPWALSRDRWLWFALFIGIFFTTAMLMGTWVFPHYAAPAAGLFFVLVVQSMRSLHAWHWGTGARAGISCAGWRCSLSSPISNSRQRWPARTERAGTSRVRRCWRR